MWDRVEGDSEGQTNKVSGFQTIVLEAGIEPALPKEYDFESYASTNSATPAQ